MSTIVSLTERAQKRVADIYTNEVPNGDKSLRLKVNVGGCSGFTYKMEFSEKQEKDHVFTIGDLEIVIDPNSLLFLEGIEVDFEDGLSGRGFVFNNPNAVGTCSCGESFKV